jgi:hypothetical protein
MTEAASQRIRSRCATRQLAPPCSLVRLLSQLRVSRLTRRLRAPASSNSHQLRTPTHPRSESLLLRVSPTRSSEETEWRCVAAACDLKPQHAAASGEETVELRPLEPRLGHPSCSACPHTH